jgi:DNA-binding MarR family transcriptional regulator
MKGRYKSMDEEERRKVIKAYMEIFRLIHQRSYSHLEKLKLYPGQPQLLALINRKEGITQKELSEKNCVKPATITGILNKLEKNHFVYRMSDKEDKRIMRVYLTDDGRKVAENAEHFIQMVTEKMFFGFSDEEVEQFLHLANKIRNNLQ